MFNRKAHSNKPLTLCDQQYPKTVCKYFPGSKTTLQQGTAARYPGIFVLCSHIMVNIFNCPHVALMKKFIPVW